MALTALRSSSAVLPALLLSLPTLTSAFTWNFEANPQQCRNLSISISGDDGKPPYSVLILPFGASPLPDNIEARRISEHTFADNAKSVSFQLQYPANSQLVAVVSDSSGFGVGGTSVSAAVTESDDSSCFDSKNNVQADFFFSIEPPHTVVQCEPSRLWWDPATVRGTPKFLGVIPGGQSFLIPQGEITQVASQGTGFTWRPSLRAGTSFLLVGGDDRGNGTAGSASITVSNGINGNDNSCLNANSPSSTPGSPAGGSYPTGTSGSGSGGQNGGNSGGGDDGGGSSPNIGAIVGGVVGGAVFIIALILVILFFRRRKRLHKKQKERPVDLLDEADEGDDNVPHAHGGNRNELPHYYQPEPFMVPDPTVGSSSADGHTDGRMSADGRPLSGVTSTSRSNTPDLLGGSTTSGGRKGLMRPLRPVNIIQHDDAGPSEAAAKEDDPETIELPPAYTNIRK